MAFELPLTETATLLQQSLQRYLADHPKPDFAGLAELGLMAVGVPEEAGGVGGGAIERAAIMAELGPALAGSDWLAHHLGASLLARLAPDHGLLAALASGEARIALALDDSGEVPLVPGAAEADWLILAGPAQTLLVKADASGLSRRRRAMMDGSVAADLSIGSGLEADSVLAEDVDASAAAEWARDVRQTALCAEAAGLMGRMLADTAAYLQQRKQFGVAIASFQVLRHRLADMQMAALKAEALTERAVLAEGTPGWGHAVSAAAVETIDTVRTVGEGAVQLHGGMGVTEELSLGGQFKRGLAIAAALGSKSQHLIRHAELA
ncbi:MULTISPECIES: acyl-CoA dehydrogenase family protein [unclassified Novosphingobium]|uniref:acyl-CoA dehydrogenase family protein n=1 Tax=unclassified Novosphingobium TaxID=2644732 RepID=UPI000EC29676|nr:MULTISPECIES: acyl-CoA dehydrogenase family protein [unclassified Novosphingobium]HCF25456.1 acyl-CoA dehydrogenase [Novosphingobium sp.]HQV04282.1 acyl-CoA dehydrogenase family protein [Novosphingobium sp.]